MIYLDYASTTPLDPFILDTYYSHQRDHFINSASTYPQGVKLKFELEHARKSIAELFSVDAKDLIFTASGSEANSLAIKGIALAHQHKGKHLITSKIEHPSVLESFQQLETSFGFEVDYLDVDKNGILDLNQLSQCLRKDTILVSLMQVNNEVGSQQPIQEASQLIRSKSKAIFHCDMVQALGKHPLALAEVDLASFSAHKIFGFKGVGLLYKRHHLELLPLISGGAQEFGLRGGTTPTSLFISLYPTIKQALVNLDKHHQMVSYLNQYLRQHLAEIKHLQINSDETASPYILSISHLKLGSEIVKNHLLSHNILVASRSTCSSKSDQPSHVLKAMGLSMAAQQGVIRLSLSHQTQISELEVLIKALKEVNQYVR